MRRGIAPSRMLLHWPKNLLFPLPICSLRAMDMGCQESQRKWLGYWIIYVLINSFNFGFVSIEKHFKRIYILKVRNPGGMFFAPVGLNNSYKTKAYWKYAKKLVVGQMWTLCVMGYVWAGNDRRNHGGGRSLWKQFEMQKKREAKCLKSESHCSYVKQTTSYKYASPQDQWFKCARAKFLIELITMRHFEAWTSLWLSLESVFCMMYKQWCPCFKVVMLLRDSTILSFG